MRALAIWLMLMAVGAGQGLGPEVESALQKKDCARARKALARASREDPKGWEAGRYRAAWRKLARNDVALLRAGDHPAVGWVALPKEWSPKKRYRVLVAIEGAGCHFLSAAHRFRKTRGKRDVIVLVPHTFTNTNALNPKRYPFYDPTLLKKYDRRRGIFDREGMFTLLARLEEDLGGRTGFFMTGFSGGGNLTYWWLFQRPADLAGVVPVAANFSGLGLSGSAQPENGGPPVHVMTGADDPHGEAIHGKHRPGIDGQNGRALEALHGRGYKRVKFTRWPGVGHAPMPKRVWEFIDKVEKR